jgi:hypothetical protein
MSQPTDKDPPGLDQLAKRYMELWQDQLAAMSADPELLAGMSRFMSGALAQGMAGMAPVYTQPRTADRPSANGAAANGSANGSAKPNGHDRNDGNGYDTGAQAGTPAAAAAPDDRSLGVSELIHRLGLIEARLASLEAGIARGRGSADGGAEARRSAKIRKRP